MIDYRYQLLDEIGHGGMGAVFRAQDRLTGEIVALKQVLTRADQPLGSTEAQTDSQLALAQEFRTVASLRHPHIVSVLDYGFDEPSASDQPSGERQPYLTMDLIVGARTLTSAAAAMPLMERVRLLIEILEALAYLHRRGILHRDLKPANVLVTQGDQVKVVDFGLALAREDWANTDTAGTLAYIAPEALLGAPLSEATDLYALGVMGYEIIVGQHPFHNLDVQQLIRDVLSTEPDLNALQTALEKLTTETEPVSAPAHPSADFAATLDDDAPTLIINELMSIFAPTGAPAAIMSSDTSSASPPSLIDVIARLMNKKPETRYPSADAAIAALYRFMGDAPRAESHAVRESFLQAAAFIGRTDELKRLTSSLEVAHAEGRGSAWLIGGESGVGKSRLVDELRTLALVRGATVVRGQAVEDGGLPYQVWRAPVRRLALSAALSDLEAGILREFVPDIEALLDRVIPAVPELTGAAVAQRLTLTLIDLFQRQTRPILLILEDLQWADDSLPLVAALTRIAAETRLMIVGTYRDDDAPDLPDRLTLANPMKLERLTPDGIAALSQAMLGAAGGAQPVIDLIQRETEGNIFFVVEVVRALAEEAGSLNAVGADTLPARIVSGGIRAIIERRLERVPASHQPLLRAAAVAGREIDLRTLRTLRRLADDSASALDTETWLFDCADAAVLDVADGRWRFSHDKLRAALLDRLADAERAALHGQIAGAIERAYPDDSAYAATLAEHWRAAGDATKEIHYALIAGEQANRTSRFVEAAAYFERVRTLAPDDARALVGLGESLEKRSDYEGAIQTLQAAIDQLPPGEPRIYALTLMANTLFQRGEHAAAALWGERALDAARAFEGDPRAGQRLIALSLQLIANSALRRGDIDLSEQRAREALEITRAIDDRVRAAWALTMLGALEYDRGHYEAVRAYWNDALIMRRELGDSFGIALLLGNMGAVEMAQGDYGKARALYNESLLLKHVMGDRSGTAITLMNLGIVNRYERDFETARVYFEDSLAIMTEVGHKRGVSMNISNLGQLMDDMGDHARALHYNQEAVRMARELDDQYTLSIGLGAVAATYVNLNQIEAAWLPLNEGVQIARAIQSEFAQTSNLAVMAKIRLAQGDLETTALYFGLIMNHPASDASIRTEIERVDLPALRTRMDGAALDAALARGAAFTLDDMLKDANFS